MASATAGPLTRLSTLVHSPSLVVAAMSSILTRLAHTAPVGRRAYSFFSSNGRYFTAHSIAATGPNSSDGRKPPPPASTVKPKAATTETQSTTAPTVQGATQDAAEPSVSEGDATVRVGQSSSSWHATFVPTPSPIHPSPTAQDFKLHQLFSLDRPLLGLSQPGASVFENSPTPFAPSTWTRAGSEVEQPSATYMDEHADPSPEADAHTARQLSRAFVMNRVASTVDFNAAMMKLGLDMNEGRVPVQEMDMSNMEMHLDSVKRKRKQKMKKHK
jgi:hypothetical protein